MNKSTNTTPDNGANNQPTVNERLDEILTKLENAVALNIGSQGMRGEAPKRSHWKAKQAITSLIKELVAEAKPGVPEEYERDDALYIGFERGTEHYYDAISNLLKALEEE